jgi:hypothetical protein
MMPHFITPHAIILTSKYGGLPKGTESRGAHLEIRGYQRGILLYFLRSWRFEEVDSATEVEGEEESVS